MEFNARDQYIIEIQERAVVLLFFNLYFEYYVTGLPIKYGNVYYKYATILLFDYNIIICVSVCPI